MDKMQFLYLGIEAVVFLYSDRCANLESWRTVADNQRPRKTDY